MADRDGDGERSCGAAATRETGGHSADGSRQPDQLGQGEQNSGKTSGMTCIPPARPHILALPSLFLAHFPSSPLSSLTFLPLLSTLLPPASVTAAALLLLRPRRTQSPGGQGRSGPSKRAEVKGVELAVRGGQEPRLNAPVLGLMTMIPESSQSTRGWGRKRDGAGLQRTGSLWAEKGRL